MLRYACSPEAPDLWPSGATLAACSYRPCSVGCAVSPALGGCAVGLLLSLFGSCRVSSSGPPPRFGSSAFWNGFYVYQAVRNEAAGKRRREGTYDVVLGLLPALQLAGAQVAPVLRDLGLAEYLSLQFFFVALKLVAGGLYVRIYQLPQ